MQFEDLGPEIMAYKLAEGSEARIVIARIVTGDYSRPAPTIQGSQIIQSKDVLQPRPKEKLTITFSGREQKLEDVKAVVDHIEGLPG